jgi:thiamine transporter
MNTTQKTQRLTLSAVMLAMATVLAVVCELIPFLNLPFGGGFTVASMLPIIIISYMYGIKWGLFISFTYSCIQIILSLIMGKTVLALFTPSSDDYMGLFAAFAIIVIDYLLAYTVLGLGGIFRKCIKNKVLAIVLGVLVALSLRYICHIISGYIFYGAWAEWFFSQEGFYAIGSRILDTFSGKGLALLYSIFYNGLYMIPEIIITSIAASVVCNIRFIRRMDVAD